MNLGASQHVNLKRVADFIASPECKNIAVLTGAGMSCGAGIPDFRSPGGMYQTLKPELITATDDQKGLMRYDPTYVVEKSMFMQNQFPYCEVRRPFILGTEENKWQATIAHRFLEILHQKTNKLTRLYTQNIDGLDYQCTSIPNELIVPVHGTIRKVACETCGQEDDFSEFCQNVRTNIKDIYGIDPTAPKESKNILCKSCNAPTMKPTTVLFGSSLPQEFFSYKDLDMDKIDLLIIAGTSLVVSPANSIASDVSKNAMRLIVNHEKVGQGLGIEYNDDPESRDIFGCGDCDDIFLQLIDLLGWRQDIEAFYHVLPESCQSRLRPTDNQAASTP
jgi:NAD-dependent SIR2 family protein deacetylase